MNETTYPGVFLRVKSAMIDSVIIVLFMLAATDVFSNLEDLPTYIKIITFTFIILLYDPLMVSFFGATIGHRMNKLKVQRLDNGKKINLVSAIIRFLIKSTLGLVSLITISTKKNRQAIHDTWVNSVVVYDN